MAGHDEIDRAVVGNRGIESIRAAGSEQHPKKDRERAVDYLNHLKTQFQKTEIQGLAEQVLRLLAESPYAARIEREVIGIKGVAVTSHYINQRSEFNSACKAFLWL